MVRKTTCEGTYYNVLITETLEKIVTVFAYNADEARAIVADRHRNSDYILGADDFVSLEIDVQEKVYI